MCAKQKMKHFLLFLRILLNITQNISVLTMEVRDYQRCDVNVKPCGLVDKYVSIKMHGFVFQSTVTLILL